MSLILLLYYKAHHALTSKYLSDLSKDYYPSQNLRNSDLGLFTIPPSNKGALSDRAFSVAASVY